MRICRDILEGMIDHARRDSPIEACGFLAGKGAAIERLIPATNERKSPIAFSVPVAELFDLFRYLRSERLNLLGIYHSHPGSAAVPSKQDRELFFYPGISYWIVSLATNPPDIRCFSWGKMDFERIDYVVLT